MKPAAFLLFPIKGETQATAINPTLADRLQSPYSLLSREGICDLSQAHGVGDLSKTVALLGKADSGFSCLAGDVLMTIKDHLSRERRMAADLDGDVAPLRIEDMKRIVVDIGHRPFWFDMMVGANIPHRRLSSAHQNQKQALGDLGLCQVFFGQFMLVLPGVTMQKWNVLGFRIPMNAAAKTARHPHEVSVVQSLL